MMQRGGFGPSGGEVLLPVVVLGFLHELRGGWSRLSPEQWVLFRLDEDPVPLSLLEAASFPFLAVEFRVLSPGGARGHGTRGFLLAQGCGPAEGLMLQTLQRSREELRLLGTQMRLLKSVASLFFWASVDVPPEILFTLSFSLEN